MAGRVEGLCAVVTGGGQGIGLACARRLAEEGARVIISDTNVEIGEAAARAIDAQFIYQDVAIEADWLRLSETLSDNDLHILVNNAAIEGDVNAAKDPEAAPLADWNRIFEVNTAGTFLGCKHAIPIIARSGGGAIINMSSVATMVPTPFITAYGASKAAVEHLTRSVALHCAEKAYRIRANSVHPGQVRTPMLDAFFERQGGAVGQDGEAIAEQFVQTIPMRCFQDPQDIANLVLFLASDEARFITGQAIACDGGFTLAH